MAAIFLVVRLVPPHGFSPAFFNGFGYAPDTYGHKHFGVAWPDDPDPDAAVSLGLFS